MKRIILLSLNGFTLFLLTAYLGKMLYYMYGGSALIGLSQSWALMSGVPALKWLMAVSVSLWLVYLGVVIYLARERYAPLPTIFSYILSVLYGLICLLGLAAIFLGDKGSAASFDEFLPILLFAPLCVLAFITAATLRAYKQPGREAVVEA